MPLQIESHFDLFARYAPGNLGIVHDQLAEVEPFFPGVHGVALHQTVGIFAGDAMLNQVEQELSAENQAARAFQVRQHTIRVDEHCLNQVGRLAKHVVNQSG